MPPGTGNTVELALPGLLNEPLPKALDEFRIPLQDPFPVPFPEPSPKFPPPEPLLYPFPGFPDPAPDPFPGPTTPDTEVELTEHDDVDKG